MRYYFHLVGPDDGILDEVGSEASSFEAAKAAALLAVQEILAEHEDEGESWHGWRLEMTDAFQRVAFTIDLDQQPHPEYMTAQRPATGIGGYVLHSLLASLTCGIVWQKMVPLI